MTDTQLFTPRLLIPPHTFTEGIEGATVDADGWFYAVDYARKGTIGRVAPDGQHELFVMLPPGSVGCGMRAAPKHTLYVADYTGHHVLAVDLKMRDIRVHAHEPRMNQPNDLAIRSDGMLFASDPNWAEQTGQLWRIEPDGRVVRLEDGMGTTNGIEITPDERSLLVNESIQRRIWIYDLTADGGISNKRLLVEFPDHLLDGMRCGMDGSLYVTRFGKGTIAVLGLDGVVQREVVLGGKNCTNLTFGGPDGRTVYVTLADTGAVETFRADTVGRCFALQH